MAEWLGRGLQNLVRRFESVRDLQKGLSLRDDPFFCGRSRPRSLALCEPLFAVLSFAYAYGHSHFAFSKSIRSCPRPHPRLEKSFHIIGTCVEHSRSKDLGWVKLSLSETTLYLWSLPASKLGSLQAVVRSSLICLCLWAFVFCYRKSIWSCPRPLASLESPS